MKKRLLLLGALAAGLTLAAQDVEVTNLTPNFDFNSAETPLQLAGQDAVQWNLPLGWVKNNVINGDIDATGGIIVLSGGNPVQNNPTFYQSMNQNARLIDLGGTCGKVWAMNWSDSRLKETLSAEYGIEADLPKLGLLVGWYQQYHYILIPDPAVMKEKAGQTLRCRIEMNIFKNEALAENAFYGYRMDDQGNTETADYNVAAANRVQFSDFFTDGKWDATRWLVYEFEFTVPNAPGNLAEWETAPRIKIETDKAQNSCLMIRGITVYDPDEVPGIAPVDRTQKVYNTYTVGATDPSPIDPDVPEDPFDNADDISGNRFLSESFLFNSAETPLKIATQSRWEWNLPSEWVWQNFISGSNYQEGGSIALSGSYVISQEPQAYERMNEHIHMLDMGGECGKVWALNFNRTAISQELSSRFGITAPAGGFVPNEGWETKYNLWFIPDWQEMAAEAVNTVKTFRVRMEVNLFDNDGSESMTLKSWGVNDVGMYSEADVDYANAHPLKASEFLTDGDWDPTKWRAYEFEFDLQLAPGSISEWRKSPIIKVDVAGCDKGTLLIRNIFIWQPQASRAVSLEPRRTEKWSRYSVNQATTGIDDIAELNDGSVVAVDGRSVIVAEDAEVFDLTGRKAAFCPAGSAVELPAGFYVARTVSGGSEKFVIR